MRAAERAEAPGAGPGGREGSRSLLGKCAAGRGGGCSRHSAIRVLPDEPDSVQLWGSRDCSPARRYTDVGREGHSSAGIFNLCSTWLLYILGRR